MLLTNRMIAEQLGNPAGYDDYLHDVNAALKLPLDKGEAIELRVFSSGYADARIVSVDDIATAWYDKPTPAEAVCTAWYYWRTA